MIPTTDFNTGTARAHLDMCLFLSLCHSIAVTLSSTSAYIPSTYIASFTGGEQTEVEDRENTKREDTKGDCDAQWSKAEIDRCTQAQHSKKVKICRPETGNTMEIPPQNES